MIDELEQHADDNVTRMNLVVDRDIPALLRDLAGGKKSMGMYLSRLLRDAYAAQVAQAKQERQTVGQLDLLAATTGRLSQRVAELEARLYEIERRKN